MDFEDRVRDTYDRIIKRCQQASLENKTLTYWTMSQIIRDRYYDPNVGATTEQTISILKYMTRQLSPYRPLYNRTKELLEYFVKHGWGNDDEYEKGA